MKQNITPELIRAGLEYVPANLTRDEWAGMGMAIKSEFPDDVGFNLFNGWSSTADNYDPKATRSTWRSIKAAGGIRIGSLLHLAQKNGFVLPKADQAPVRVDPAELARRKREREERDQHEKDSTQAGYVKAATEAETQWQDASATGASAYLDRKGVGAHGVRFAADGSVLVPLRDAAGKLWNVERIEPAKDKLKKGLRGGRRAGVFHLIGKPAGVVLVCEGYATGASLFEATGHAVVVASADVNLSPVAKALRSQYPAALLVVCGDDDVHTHARTGNNPGRDKATATAAAVQGLAVFPAPLPEGVNFDFNDLHQAAGLDAVRGIVEAAIEAHRAGQTGAMAAQPSKSRNASLSVSNEPSGPASEPHHAFDPFFVNEKGVYHQGINQDGSKKQEEWICSRLIVEARTRDQDGSGWGYLLVFLDPLGARKQWAMPARMLSGDAGESRSMLLNMGLLIASSPRARNLLTTFIQTRMPDEFVICTERVGWHPPGFVLPDETIGGGEERTVFQTDRAIENTFRKRGELEQWRDRVAKPCVGNSRLVLSVACAFAGPLLRLAGIESGGLHVVGPSSNGKTTILRLSASVWGGESFKRTWQGTGVGFEVVAAASCDTVLLLDELKESEGKVASQVIYMLGNQQGKMRGNTGVQMRPMTRWNLLFLSTGEITLEQHLASAGLKIHEGQKTRLANVPADAGMGMGVFENLHGHANGAAFANHLTRQTQAVHGTAGRAWLEHLTSQDDGLRAQIREATDALAAKLVPKDSSGQVERVGARFALIGVAGEMATAAGLTGWPAGESEAAVTACFGAWLAARGGSGDGEVVAMLRQVRRFLELHGEGKFTLWHRASDDHGPKTLVRAGFRRMLGADGRAINNDNQYLHEFGEKGRPASGESVTFEYFVMAEAFRDQVCEGLDYKTVCRVLLDRGCLIPEKKGEFTCRPDLPTIGKTQCFRIPPAIFALEL